MPMTLNIGHSRKVGEPNYSSRGASLNLQIEVEGSLVNEPQRLRESIRNLFALARSAVEEELHGSRSDSCDRPAVNGNGSAPPPATASQLRAIQALSRRRQVDLSSLLGDRYGHDQPDRLSLNEASSLIEDLNSPPPPQTAGGQP